MFRLGIVHIAPALVVNHQDFYPWSSESFMSLVNRDYTRVVDQPQVACR